MRLNANPLHLPSAHPSFGGSSSKRAAAQVAAQQPSVQCAGTGLQCVCGTLLEAQRGGRKAVWCRVERQEESGLGSHVVGLQGLPGHSALPVC